MVTVTLKVFILFATIVKVLTITVPLVGGGLEANSGQFPWYASLISTNTGQLRCGGFLISPDYVMTAAHCFEPSYIVGLGSTKLDEPNLEVPSRRFISHPNPSYFGHSKSCRFMNSNDIALVQLSTSVTFNELIKPIKLATKDIGDLTGKVVMVAGFGATKGKYS